jgi:hypothetical protein
MIIAIPTDEDLCVAPELAILTALEASLAIAAQVLNIAHTEILAPGSPRLDTRVAAELIAEAARMIATIKPMPLRTPLPRRLPLLTVLASRCAAPRIKPAPSPLKKQAYAQSAQRILPKFQTPHDCPFYGLISTAKSLVPLIGADDFSVCTTTL